MHVSRDIVASFAWKHNANFTANALVINRERIDHPLSFANDSR